MIRAKTWTALILAMLLVCLSMMAEAAARLVDKDAGMRGQVNIDSGQCVECDNATEDESGGGGDNSGNTIIFE